MNSRALDRSSVSTHFGERYVQRLQDEGNQEAKSYGRGVQKPFSHHSANGHDMRSGQQGKEVDGKRGEEASIASDKALAGSVNPCANHCHEKQKCQHVSHFEAGFEGDKRHRVKTVVTAQLEGVS